MALFALAAAVVTPNGAVAALVSMAVVIAIRMDRSPSTLLMPLAFVASAGSLLALTGSPVNVIVSEAVGLFFVVAIFLVSDRSALQTAGS